MPFDVQCPFCGNWLHDDCWDAVDGHILECRDAKVDRAEEWERAKTQWTVPCENEIRWSPMDPG